MTHAAAQTISTEIRLTRAEAFEIANALNVEAAHFDRLRAERADDVPEQSLLVWLHKAERNRELSRRIALHFYRQADAA